MRLLLFGAVLPCWLLLFAAIPASGAAPTTLIAQDPDAELEALIQSERVEADLLRRRGERSRAGKILKEHLRDEPGDSGSRALRARLELDKGDHAKAERDASRALEDAGPAGPGAALAREVLAELALELGDPLRVLALLRPAGEPAEGVELSDPRVALLLGRALEEAGQTEEARQAWRDGAQTQVEDWRSLLARGHCQHKLGELVGASRSIVAADKAAREAGGLEPDVLVALADLYFESEREVAKPGARSAGALYKEALELHPTHEAGLLGLFSLHRYNRRRVSRSPQEILDTLLTARPKSVDGLVTSASADLSDGQLRGVRKRLGELEQLAPKRRDVRTLHAALAWVEHRREDCEAILKQLAEVSPKDSTPERQVGTFLIELYRFGEAGPFLARAVGRDPSDYEAWTRYANSLANTGQEEEAREAFARAKESAAGRQDAWRNNVTLSLERIKARHVLEDHGELSFSWQPDAAGRSAHVPRSLLRRGAAGTGGTLRLHPWADADPGVPRASGFLGALGGL